MKEKEELGQSLVSGENTLQPAAVFGRLKRFRRCFTLSLLLLLAGNVFSQSDIAEFLKAGKADANSLIQAYLNPYANAFGDGLNMGWYNSAKTHKLGGFDLSISATAIKIPDSGLSFDLNSLKLTELTLADPTKHLAPTVAGKKEMGPELLVKNSDGSTAFSFNTPEGVDMNVVPMPMVQFTVGFLPHTDVIGRFVPKIKYDNDGDKMNIGFWGIGIKHNFKEWIPVIKDLPFDAALFGSVSQVNGQSELTFTPQDYDEPSAVVTYTETKDQLLDLKTKTSRFGIIVSKKIGVLTVFGSLGQSSSEINIDVLGKYPVLKDKNGELVISDEDAIYDPVSIAFKTSNISADLGLRLKLGFFSIFTSMNKAEYVSYTAGISLGFR